MAYESEKDLLTIELVEPEEFAEVEEPDIFAEVVEPDDEGIEE